MSNQIEITPALLESLKQKAGEAHHINPGPWTESITGECWLGVYDSKGVRVMKMDFLSSQPFVAAANPATVLALVDEIERLRKFANALKAMEKQRWELAAKLFGFEVPE